MIDISTVEYDVELLTEDGERYLLGGALLSLQWEEQKNELAQRATLTVANATIGDTDVRIMSVAKINCVILIYGRWGDTRELVFEGSIWEWQYTSSTRKQLSITAYDKLIRLQQSKDFKYYSAGMSTQAIIGDICGDWGIPLAYKWGRSMTHENKVFSAERISDMIIGLLEEVRLNTGEKFIAYFRGGELQIVGYGMNKPIYRFDGENVTMTTDKLSINNLVTRVKIIGKQDDAGRVSVDAIVDGNTDYGVMQEIVRRDSNKTIEAAKAEADTILKERGKPEETTRITVPDLPFLRKGDKIEAAAGNLIGFFHVMGVAHIAAARQMTLTLERTPG